jgi:hypothetical protein
MRKFLFGSALSLVIVSLLVSGYCAWKLRDLSAKFDDLSFEHVASDYGYDNDLLTPNVGTIQFMHKGYTVTFDTVSYTPGGLDVTGTLGNPTQLTLSSINLKLSARQYLFKNREKILKDPFFLYGDTGDIGSGQTAITYLGPGKTATFAMTIPNVKQTSEGIQIVASFSGERYSY